MNTKVLFHFPLFQSQRTSITCSMTNQSHYILQIRKEKPTKL